MRVLLDTNIVLDVLLARAPFDVPARAVWQACAHGQCTGFLAAISMPTLWYVGRKIVGPATARQHVADLLQLFQICPVSAAVLAYALADQRADDEDAVQIAAATAMTRDAIVTRNSADFAGCSMPLFTPAAFLTHLSATPSDHATGS